MMCNGRGRCRLHRKRREQNSEKDEQAEHQPSFSRSLK
jgi:hypothetical protein